MKFAWKILVDNSLWSNFFTAKYIRNKHVSLVDSHKGTRFWKSVIQCIPDVLWLTKWRIKEGKVSFWRDWWFDEGPLVQLQLILERPNLMIKECRLEAGWDTQLVRSLVGDGKVEQVMQVLNKCRQGADLLVWSENADGKFSSKSAWECIRIKAPKNRWSDWVWHPCMPKKFSVTMWKAIRNGLSVDDRIKNVGIPVVSKCNCCTDGGYEDLEHVLVDG
ncbi:uncharacterized protein LOC121242180 [Juglans microcarpa x Juglans regia]|uniref:uncharacterized protein LOC121242180 n=1 Tax=Juglans microcarpa x Juglans regia TaxID=2249226 RepID=UPI001B7DAD32|nr:uncharacterized protein LOC121242180 [Juglans microcarpa x Juglans regia]